MRLTIQAENIWEFILLKLGLISPLSLLPALGVGVSQVLITSVRLNVFDSLKNSPKTASELAKELNCPVIGIEVLLESLDGFGFVKRDGDRYKLTKESTRWLTNEGGFTQDFIRFSGDVSHHMVLLEENIRTGKVANHHFHPQSPTCFANYLTILKGSSQEKAPKMIQWLQLDSPPQKLLDVAGGPGEYSIAFCQHYPKLQADIIDLPYAAAEGKSRIKAVGLSDRIRYIEANLLNIEWGENYDLVFLFNMLHVLTAEQCYLVLEKAFAALRQGGKVVINETFHPGREGKLTSPISLLSLMYYVTCGSRAWPKSTYQKWLIKTGFQNLRFSRWKLTYVISGNKL